MGIWEAFDEGLTKEQFRADMIAWLECADMEWVLEAEHEGKVRPVGLALGWLDPGGRGVQPHVEWFPWPSIRSKFEAALHFFREVRREYKLMIFSTVEDRQFYDRIAKRHLLEPGKKVNDWFSPGEDAYLYFTQGPFT